MPIYGFGLSSLFLLSRIDLSFIQNKVVRVITQLIIMTLILTLIEYIGGLIFIKGMKIKLWDYSNRWGNIQGIVCPLFTLFWFVACGVYYLIFDSYILVLANWFDNNIYYSFFVGIFFGILLIDFASSIHLASKISKMAKESKLTVKWEEFKDSIADHMHELKEKRGFIQPFSSSIGLKASFEHYANVVKNKISEKIDQIKDELKEKENE